MNDNQLEAIAKAAAAAAIAITDDADTVIAGLQIALISVARFDGYPENANACATGASMLDAIATVYQVDLESLARAVLAGIVDTQILRGGRKKGRAKRGG